MAGVTVTAVVNPDGSVQLASQVWPSREPVSVSIPSAFRLGPSRHPRFRCSCRLDRFMWEELRRIRSPRPRFSLCRRWGAHRCWSGDALNLKIRCRRTASRATGHIEVTATAKK